MHLSKIRPNGDNTKSKKLMEALGLSLGIKDSSSEEVIQAASGLTWQHKCAPVAGWGQLGVRRFHGSPPCCYAPRAAKAIIALIFDRMFAFELNLPPLSNSQQFSSAQSNEELGSFHGGWRLALQRPLLHGNERRRWGGEEKNKSVIFSDTDELVGNCCLTLTHRTDKIPFLLGKLGYQVFRIPMPSHWQMQWEGLPVQAHPWASTPLGTHSLPRPGWVSRLLRAEDLVKAA